LNKGMKTITPILGILILLSIRMTPATSNQICLQAEELKLYNLIMEYRKEKNLESIPLSSKLTQVAQAHAKDLSENFKPFDKPCNLHSWSKKGKWDSCCYTDDHKKSECMWSKPKEIAGYESNGYEIACYHSAGANAIDAIKGWKESPGHNRVMINDGIWKQIKWNAIGIGIYKEYGVVWFGDLKDEVPIVNCE
jgi:uncharacterized protein YkwD